MTQAKDLLQGLSGLSAPQLRRLLTEHLAKQKLGLYWEASAIERDEALNANIVLPRVVEENSHNLNEVAGPGTPNLIIEGDNFDSLRLLKTTHAGKVRVIYIDPPYNTGNKDWVYNDRYVGANDRWRHSQWLEFLYRRLTLAKDLLTQDGVIMVSINDENRARLELLMDEVFPGRRVGSLVWRTRDSTSAKTSNFSDVHEHVLIYAAAGFAFNGRDKTQKKYKNPDNDPRGPWNGDPLTLAFDRFDRKNLYYPITNPSTEVWYPCDANRVWCYASEKNLKDGAVVRTETMEEFIRQEKILFPKDEQVKVWISLDELLADIDKGEIPVTPKRKRPLLNRDTPNLEFWLHKKVGFGRPLFKKHWKDLQSHTSPLSSWIARVNEDEVDEDTVTLNSPQAGEGSEIIQEIFGSKVFQYPKPPTLIRELIRQASRENDTVLDFFAGSGTTAQVVLELNAEDEGTRKFILCSSTEVTDKEPEKNLCRDICAERVRRAMVGYGTKEGLGGSFAYLQLDKIAPGDAPFDSNCAQAFQLLTMRLGQVARPVPHVVDDADSGVKVLVQNAGGVLTVLCHKLTRAALDALSALPGKQLRVYSARPATVREHFNAQGREVESLSLARALLHGQQVRRAKVRSPVNAEGAV